MNAFSIGEIVKIVGLPDYCEMNGCFCVVKDIREDIVGIKVFLNHELNDPEWFDLMPLPEYFTNTLSKPENLLLLTSEDWKPEFAPPDLRKGTPEHNALAREHLSEEQYAEYSRFMSRMAKIGREYPFTEERRGEIVEDLKLVEVWLNQVFETSFYKELPVFYFEIYD